MTLPTSNSPAVSPPDPARWLIAWVVGLNLAADLLMLVLGVVPQFRELWPALWERPSTYWVVGISNAQTTLPAIWAALGPGKWNRRVPWAILLAALSWIAPGRFLSETPREQGASYLYALATAVQFVFLWAVFAVLARRLKLSLRDPAGDLAPVDPPRFGLAEVLLWMTGIAVLLGVTRAAFLDADPTGFARQLQAAWLPPIAMLITISLFVGLLAVGMALLEGWQLWQRMLLGLVLFLLATLLEDTIQTRLYGLPAFYIFGESAASRLPELIWLLVNLVAWPLSGFTLGRAALPRTPSPLD